MINSSGRDVDSFQLVVQDESGSEESQESEVQIGSEWKSSERQESVKKKRQRETHLHVTCQSWKRKGKGSKKGKTVRSGSVRAISANDQSEVIRMADQSPEDHSGGSDWQSECIAMLRSVRHGSVSTGRSTRNLGLGTLVKRIRMVSVVDVKKVISVQQTGRISQCLQDHFGSIRSQNHEGQCNHCQCTTTRTLGEAGEDQWISQCSQDSFDSWGAGRLPTQLIANWSQSHAGDQKVSKRNQCDPFDSWGAGRLPTQLSSAQLSQDKGFK
eukprot:613039-Amphidinium_carterae.1